MARCSMDRAGTVSHCHILWAQHYPVRLRTGLDSCLLEKRWAVLDPLQLLSKKCPDYSVLALSEDGFEARLCKDELVTLNVNLRILLVGMNHDSHVRGQSPRRCGPDEYVLSRPVDQWKLDVD